MGVEFENNPISDTNCGGEVVKECRDDVVLQITDTDDLNKSARRNSNETMATSPSTKQETASTNTTTTATTTTTTTATLTKPVSNTTNYSTTSSKKLSKENVNTDASNEDVVSKSAHTNDNSKGTPKETHLNCEKDELVLDVLNDDLIEKVRGKFLCKLMYCA